MTDLRIVPAAPARGSIIGKLRAKSSGITVYQSNELPKPSVSMCVYGSGGSGKTEFVARGAALSPYGSPVLYLDIEGGSWVFSDRDDVTVIPIRSMEDMQTVGNEIVTSDDRSFGSLIVDNLTILRDMDIRAITGTSPNKVMGIQPTQQQWGKSYIDMFMMIRGFHDWGLRTGTNVFFVCGEVTQQVRAETKDLPAIYSHKLSLGPALESVVPLIIDMVGHMTVDENGERSVNFMHTSLNSAKFRRNRGEAAMSIPLAFSYKNGQFPLVDILATLKGGDSWPGGNKYRVSALAREALKDKGDEYSPTNAATPPNTDTDGGQLVDGEYSEIATATTTTLTER